MLPGSPATPARSSAASRWREDVAFDLHKASPRLPKQEVPPGHTPMSWLRELVRQGVDELYANNRDQAERV